MAKRKPSLGREKDVLRIECFVLFNAMLLDAAVARGTLRARFLAAWRKRSRDAAVGPIFKLAREVLSDLPDGSATERVLQTLAAAAGEVAQSGALSKYDFIGRIHHKLLLGTAGHHYATYYTSPEAALVLAGLVFGPRHASWKLSTRKNLRDFRVIDPACGSGTLLSAACNAILDSRASRGANEEKTRSTIVENVVHGWDVLAFTTELAKATLALHARNPKKINIAAKPLGLEERGVRLGSLDALKSDHAEQEKFDVVLMNPPFSRSAKPNRKFGFGAADERRAMNGALGALARKYNLRKATVAGLTPFFMQLGLDLMRERGRIGVVVPRSMLSGVGTADVRKKFEAQTNLGFIVSNFDPGSAGEQIDGWSWSEHTDLGEVLITAERASPRNGTSHCTFANVTRRPRDESEASALSKKIHLASRRLRGSLLDGDFQTIDLDHRSVATVYRIPQAHLGGNWLKACTFADPTLNRVCLEILANPAMKRLETLVKTVNGEPSLGRDIAAIKPNFRETAGKSKARVVFGHQSGMNTLALDRAHMRGAEPKNPNAVRMFENFAAHLLIAERPHLLTESLLAMRAPERVVATAFWEVQPKPDCEEWLLLWLNSTYGVMTFLANATSSQADIFKMKKDQLRDLPVPEPSKTSDARRLYREIKQQRFARYADEFRLAAEGRGPRHALDDFFAAALKLPALTPELYLALSRDPPVSRKALVQE